MLTSCGKKLLLSLLGSTLTCLLVLMGEQPSGHGALLLRRGSQGWAPSGEPPGQEPDPPQLRSFSGYFSQLSRAKREEAGGGGSQGPAGGRRRQQQPPAPAAPREEISPRDVFIAVKTTKKFHKARLELLLDTWISRHQEMVRGRGWGVCVCGGGGPWL